MADTFIESRHTFNRLIIAVVGRRDEPTDAVEDYCRFLGNALRDLNATFVFKRVAWQERGWVASLAELRRLATGWRHNWVLLQYTALMWSRRGFPSPFLLVVGVLKACGVQVAVVFHDQGPFGGVRMVDRIRRGCQRAVMRWACWLSDAVILTYPREHAHWLPTSRTKAVSIPIGANVPACCMPLLSKAGGAGSKTITVFGITDSGNISREVADIAGTVRLAAERMGSVRLLTLGRGSKESEPRIRKQLEGSPVEFRALGILPPEEVSRVLASSDVSLFVRGPINTQRGSAIASIAAGVPLVTYSGGTLPLPLAEAGVLGVPSGDSGKLAEAAVRVLADPELGSDLRQRSRRAYPKHFAWEAVAGRFLEVLRIA